MHLKVITSAMTSSTGVSRNPTIPLTKRDSLALNGSRVSLISNNSNNTNHSGAHNKTNGMGRHNTTRTKTKDFKESDFVNSHPDMVAGKKRTPKKEVKRTDSYKLALNRQSAFDDIDADTRVDKAHGKHKRDCESRTKYNTLPIKMGAAIETNSQPEGSRTKHKPEKHVDGKNDQFQRSASQKSGTFPSPDTDEDQNSTQPERKKKSTFKRMKERLIQTFKKDTSTDKKSRHRASRKHKVRHRTSSTGRIRPNDHDKTLAFQTPDSNGGTDHHEPMDVDDQNSNKGKNIFQAIRTSFRRKQRPDRKSKEEPKQPSSDTQYSPHRSHPIDIPPSNTPDTGNGNAAIAGNEGDPDDTISEIFGSLIDPTSDLFTPPNCTRPDRSKLKLEGLTKFRPKSFERKDTESASSRAHSRGNYRSHGYQTRLADLSPTVEIDGLDYADGPILSTQFQEESDDANLPYSVASQTEQQRRVDDVARRLAAIGDRIVIDKESESATSSDRIVIDKESESATSSTGAGPRRLSALEQEILEELRRYADTKNEELSREGGVCIYLAPIIKKILTAHSYNEFKQVVHRELSNTMGWETVAWYTYLMKTTMRMVVSGRDVGTIVRNNATRYFNTNIRPFIESRRNGWESIVEETDAELDDSELD